MSDLEDGEADRGGMLGFLDADGKWATVTELEQEFGDELEYPIHELLEALDDVGMLNVRRNDDGEIVTSQLSQFAVDLFDADGDAEAALVYAYHGREPPENMRKEYADAVQEAGFDV